MRSRPLTLAGWYLALERLGVSWDRWHPDSGFGLPGSPPHLFLVGAAQEPGFAGALTLGQQIADLGGRVIDARVAPRGRVRVLIQEPDFGLIERDTPES